MNILALRFFNENQALFSRELNCFITIHPYSVKIWDDKGRLINVHKQKLKNEIVNGCID